MRLQEPRIEPLADDELSAEAREILAPMLADGRDYNIFRTLAHHPALFPGCVVMTKSRTV